MRKKLFVTLFSVCILMGAAISLVNLKSVKSLVSMNVEALTERTWDGSPLAGSRNDETGTCGILGFSNGGKYGIFYYGYVSVCHASYSIMESYKRTGQEWSYMHHWCCDQCSSTSYCTDD